MFKIDTVSVREGPMQVVTRLEAKEGTRLFSRTTIFNESEGIICSPEFRCNDKKTAADFHSLVVELLRKGEYRVERSEPGTTVPIVEFDDATTEAKKSLVLVSRRV